MASAQDFFDALQGADQRLDDIKGKLDALQASVDAVRGEVQQVEALALWGFTQLITIGQYTNRALFQNDSQNDAMICALEDVSRNTCALLNEAHAQSGLQRSIERATAKLADLFAAVHAEAALARAREEALREKIEACCPPEPPPPPCTYAPCPAPKPLTDPPPETQPPPGQIPVG